LGCTSKITTNIGLLQDRHGDRHLHRRSASAAIRDRVDPDPALVLGLGDAEVGGRALIGDVARQVIVQLAAGATLESGHADL
jgi:hypothetical protein